MKDQVIGIDLKHIVLKPLIYKRFKFKFLNKLFSPECLYGKNIFSQHIIGTQEQCTKREENFLKEVKYYSEVLTKNNLFYEYYCDSFVTKDIYENIDHYPIIIESYRGDACVFNR